MALPPLRRNPRHNLVGSQADQAPSTLPSGAWSWDLAIPAWLLYLDAIMTASRRKIYRVGGAAENEDVVANDEVA